MKKYLLVLIFTFSIIYSQCDANDDSEVNIQDIIATIDCILDTECFDGSQCDWNMDDELNIADVVMVVDIISGSSTARVANYGSFASFFEFSIAFFAT